MLAARHDTNAPAMSVIPISVLRFRCTLRFGSELSAMSYLLTWPLTWPGRLIHRGVRAYLTVYH